MYIFRDLSSHAFGQLLHLFAFRWFFENMSRERAELVLKEDGREGVFLVRQSNISDCYTVGIFTKEVGKKNSRGETLGTVRHYHIKVVKNDKGTVTGMLFHICLFTFVGLLY